jgi:hydrogenase maturation protease
MNMAVQRRQLKHSTAHDVALVALGNSLRGDDAIASHLLAGLPSGLSGSLCILDAGSYTRDLPAFLHGHRVGLIIDAAECDEMVIIDLFDIAQRQKVLLDCSHALSWLDEIVLYQAEFTIPSHLLFIGVPVFDTGWREGLSKAAREKLPLLVSQLCELIERVRKVHA